MTLYLRTTGEIWLTFELALNLLYTLVAVPNLPIQRRTPMRHWLSALTALATLAGSALPAVAADASLTAAPTTPTEDLPVPPDFSFSVGTRAWWTSGYSEFSYSFPNPHINPLSELRWRGVDALIPEVNADFSWKLLVLRAAVGWSKSEQGVLIDEDFLLDDHNGRVSVSRSSVESDIFYVNGDVGIRAYRWLSKDGRLGFFDFLGGYQYWREKYEGFGLTGNASPPLGLPVAPQSSRVFTDEFTWQSIRIGARYQVPFPKGFGFKAEAMFIPWSKFELEDIHHLRTSGMALSVRTRAFARQRREVRVQAEGAITYTIGKGFSVEGGFSLLEARVGGGRHRYSAFDRHADIEVVKVPRRSATAHLSAFSIVSE
jgi:hypothetical protein